jgi:hypothetical protein
MLAEEHREDTKRDDGTREREMVSNKNSDDVYAGGGDRMYCGGGRSSAYSGMKSDRFDPLMSV